MADIKKFQFELAETLFSPYGDSQFETIRTFCNGMSGVKTAKLLNFAVSCLDPKELYLEIGVLTGFTMISAGRGNSRSIIGIDNSSEFGNMEDRLMKNLEMFPHPSYQYISEDFRNVGIAEENERKVGVLYIDGRHDFKEVTDSFEWADRGLLADNAIIVLDDIAVNGVYEAIREWQKTHENYKMVFMARPLIDETTGLFAHDISVGLGIAVLVKTNG